MLRSWLVAVALTGVGLAVLVALIPAAPLTGDGQYYVEFVRNGLQHGASSWHERRLLGPLIVLWLPVDPLLGFQLLTLAALAATSLLMWRATASLFAIPFLLGTWAVSANLREYALVDPLAWAFVAAAWLATVRRQWLWAAAACALGVLAKEIVVLAAVAAAAAAWDSHRPLRAVAVAAPAILIAFALTLVFPGSGTDATAYLLKWIRDGLGSLGPVRAVYLVFASYGALWLLLPLGWRHLSDHLQRAGIVYLLAALALPFVGSAERMEEAIFPLMVSTAVAATRTWHRALAVAVALGNMLFVARVGGDARIPTVLAWSGLAVACAAVVAMLLRGRWPFPRSVLQRLPRQPSAPANPPP